MGMTSSRSANLHCSLKSKAGTSYWIIGSIRGSNTTCDRGYCYIRHYTDTLKHVTMGTPCHHGNTMSPWEHNVTMGTQCHHENTMSPWEHNVTMGTLCGKLCGKLITKNNLFILIFNQKHEIT